MANTPKSKESVRSENSESTNNATDPQTTPESSSLSLGAKPRACQEEKTKGDGSISTAPPNGSDGDRGKDPAVSNENPKVDADNPCEVERSSETDVEPVEKEKTVSKSIRLWKSAFAALLVMMAKYGKNKADMVSICIHAYAKKAAAAPIVRFRVLDTKWLFPLQASATDIKDGISNFEEDLLNARKSHRDPKERKLLYDQLSKDYQKAFEHAEETLTSMDKESLLHDLLEADEHALLLKLIEGLESEKPQTVAERKIRDLKLKIFKSLIL